MKAPSFESFVTFKEEASNNDWKKEHIQLEKGFIPPTKMEPVVQAFLNSGDVELMKDTSREIKMPKKPLFLAGGAVRDFLKNKTIRDYHLVTGATPEQIALILHSARFRLDGDASGLKLTFTPKEAKAGQPRTWRPGQQDSKKKPYSIIATVRGEDFEITTFRKDPKTGKPSKSVELSDNPIDDHAGRDLTINALYIELSKADGENNKVYDPSGKGYHDARNAVVRTNGKAKDRFKEDPSRVLRAIRFHCRFGKGSKMDKDIEQSIPDFKDLEGMELTDVKDEFLKGLLHPDTDVNCYLRILVRTGVIQKVLPGVDINAEIPKEFSSRMDKPLALAFALHNNPIEKAAEALSSVRVSRGKEQQTGWSDQDRRAVLFLLSLLEFDANQRADRLNAWKGTGLSKNQIKDWVDMFKITDKMGRVRNQRPGWASVVKVFADNDGPLAHADELMGMGIPHSFMPHALSGLENGRFEDLLPKK